MQKLVFLDRDGVINKYPGHFQYVASQKGFRFLPGAKASIARLTKAGYKIFVVSNQAGVSKGLYSQKTLDAITKNMLSAIKKEGGKIEKVLYCTHTDKENCNCRKPKTGLIDQALNIIREKVNIKKSFFIGDSIRDVKTGKSVGCKTILVLSGRESMENMPNWEMQPDFIAKDISRATDIIIKG